MRSVQCRDRDGLTGIQQSLSIASTAVEPRGKNAVPSDELSAARERGGGLAYRGYVLAVLVLVYTFNFIDRQILGILAVPIKMELALTDTQLGMLGGLAFALFYTFLGVPIARLADRAGRVGIIAIAVALWSAMTAACGFARSFPQLFLARVGVGVGEAGGVAPAYALICDYFPSGQRARALSVYSFGIPIGSALGILLGGYITHWMSWRIAFLVVGIAGFFTAPLLKLTVREPRRTAPGVRDSLWNVLSVLFAKPSFWALAFGGGACSMMGYGLFFWMSSFLVRSFGLSLLEASQAYGALLLVGGLLGIWMGGVIADRQGAARKSAYALVPAAAFIATIPLYFVGLLATKLWLCLAVLLVPTALGLAWLGPVLAAIQHLVPERMRSTASAVFLFINNLLGLGLGSTLIGRLSDALHVRAGTDSLRYAILAGTGCYVVAALLFYLGSLKLSKDWVE
jgi:MFS family permease